VPAAADVGFEPAGEISRRRRQRCTDVTEIPAAIAGGNVHAAAKRDGEVGVVATYAFAFVVSFPRRLGGAGVLLTERDAMMDEVADSLRPRPARRRRVLEELPGGVRQTIRLAVAAAEQINQRIRRQVFNRVLSGRRNHGIWQAAVVDDVISGQTHVARGRDDPAAPVAEHVAVRRDRHRWAGDKMIRDNDVGGAGEVHPQNQEHWCRLRKIVVHFESDTELHSKRFPDIHLLNGYKVAECKALRSTDRHARSMRCFRRKR
jgi:hypothetical protein